MSASEYLRWLNDQSDSELICHARHKDRAHEQDSSRHYAPPSFGSGDLEDATRMIKSDEDHFFTLRRPLDGMAAENASDSWHSPLPHSRLTNHRSQWVGKGIRSHELPEIQGPPRLRRTA